MAEDKTFAEIFLSREGRLNRWRFFKRSLVLGFLITAILTTGDFFLSHNWEPTTASKIFSAIVSLIFLFPTYCLDVRRLHDMNKTDLLAKINLVFGIVFAILDFDIRSATWLYTILVLAAATVSLGIGLYMLVSPGTRGRNKYGADPLGAGF